MKKECEEFELNQLLNEYNENKIDVTIIGITMEDSHNPKYIKYIDIIINNLGMENLVPYSNTDMVLSNIWVGKTSAWHFLARATCSLFFKTFKIDISSFQKI
jgi:hypothetical protein